MTICRKCEKRAYYGHKKDGKAMYCVKHKSGAMIDVTNKRCAELGCDKRPHFNVLGSKIGLYCAIHKNATMIDVTNKRCAELGCDKIPHFNVLGSKIGLYCAIHKNATMIDVTNKKCAELGCDKIPYFNVLGSKIGLYCAIHKNATMIDVKHIKCAELGCDKRPHFNVLGSKFGLYCAIHKNATMIDVTNKKCAEPDCNSRPRFNVLGSKFGLYCALHKINLMINVVDKKCIGQEGLCMTRPGKHYRGYCLFCFVNTFPDEPVIRNYKTKEYKVVEHVQSCFPDFTWRHDKRVDCAISRRRPDLFLDLGSHVLIVEVDEDSHSTYDCSCENKRIMQLSQDVDHRPLAIIRFNPDSYTDAKKQRHESCFARKRDGIVDVPKTRLPDWERRLEELVRTIRYWSENTPDKMIQVVELFMSDC